MWVNPCASPPRQGRTATARNDIPIATVPTTTTVENTPAPDCEADRMRRLHVMPGFPPCTDGGAIATSDLAAPPGRRRRGPIPIHSAASAPPDEQRKRRGLYQQKQRRGLGNDESAVRDSNNDANPPSVRRRLCHRQSSPGAQCRLLTVMPPAPLKSGVISVLSKKSLRSLVTLFSSQPYSCF